MSPGRAERKKRGRGSGYPAYEKKKVLEGFFSR